MHAKACEDEEDKCIIHAVPEAERALDLHALLKSWYKRWTTGAHAGAVPMAVPHTPAECGRVVSR
jgi:hypothetical protein